jgi:hypothetical protein
MWAQKPRRLLFVLYSWNAVCKSGMSSHLLPAKKAVKVQCHKVSTLSALTVSKVMPNWPWRFGFKIFFILSLYSIFGFRYYWQQRIFLNTLPNFTIVFCTVYAVFKRAPLKNAALFYETKITFSKNLWKLQKTYCEEDIIYIDKDEQKSYIFL